MLIHIHPHAHKHGLSDEQIISAYESGTPSIRVRERDKNTEPQRYALIGWSHHTGLPIELCFIRTGDGVFIFHANYLTESFRKEFYT